MEPAHVLAAVHVNDQLPLANGSKIVEKERRKNQRGKMIDTEIVRSGGEIELSYHAGDVEQDVLLVRPPAGCPKKEWWQ